VLAAVAVVLAAAAAGATALTLTRDADDAAAGPGGGTSTSTPADRGDPSGTPTPTPTPTPTRPPDSILTLVAAGDMLPHLSVNSDAKTDGGYDFSPLLAPMDPWVQGADLALCHMEVPVAPDGTKPSGFPMFGAPAELVTDIKESGWDGCSTASNHSVDKGQAGVDATLAAFDAVGLGHAGTARSADEGASTQFYRFERNGQTITIAHISAAYGTNGMPVANPWAVELIDTATLIAQATAARAAGADLVVVSEHCCVEYVSDPTQQQLDIAQALADSGVVDLVIGHHAHVPQPFAHLNGGPGGTGTWVAYGLGNFISNQGAHCCSAKTDSGLVMVATIRKPPDGPARVEGVQWTAVTVDLSGHRVEPLSVLGAAGQGVGSLTPAEVATRLGRVTAVVGDAAPQTTTPPTPTGPGPELIRLGPGQTLPAAPTQTG
jgi:poly-gamma-glutamate synthesis protein (capsule biosynthesis protein)